VLSRELCEALAEAYPEMREHRPQEGDWYILDGVGTGDCEIVDPYPYALSARRHDVLEAQDPKAVWCPRLDQLLELVPGVSRFADQMVLTRGYDDDRNAYRWSFTDDWGHDGPTLRYFADTPEEAIARWLLAVKETKSIGR
jgi:hypothetical protein